MSIASAITSAQNKVANAYTAVDNKGGTLPVTQNLSNLPTAIDSIPTGGIGITREVSAQGVYQMPSSFFTFALPSNATDAGNYALYYAFYKSPYLTSIDLSSLTSASGIWALNRAFSDCPNLTSADLSSLTSVSGSGALGYAFYNCTHLTSIDLSSLTSVSSNNTLNYAFGNCTGLTSVDLSNLITASGSTAFSYTFNGCTNLTSVDLSSLTTVSGSNEFGATFLNCTGLTSVDFSNLQTIGVNSSENDYAQFYNCFNNCTNLTSISFPKLEKIYCTAPGSTTAGTFSGNNKVQKFYFPKLDTITYGTGASSSSQGACKYVFSGCSSLTELHFSASNQSAIEASPGYSTAWGRGAGNVTIYFDL